MVDSQKRQGYKRSKLAVFSLSFGTKLLRFTQKAILCFLSFIYMKFYAVLPKNEIANSESRCFSAMMHAHGPVNKYHVCNTFIINL